MKKMFSRSARAALLRGLFLASAVAIVPACKHKSDDGAIPGFVGFSTTSYSVNESDGTAEITVTRTGGALGAVTVQYFTTDGTASAGSDYIPSSGTLSWADGDAAPKTFTVPILDDADVEGVEAVQLTLAAPTGGAVLQGSSALLLINEDDASTSVFQFNAVLFEAGEGAGTATITVVRTGDTTAAGSVDYATSDGTATSGSDYTAASGTLNFAAGETQKTFAVTLIQDASPEGDETVGLTLSLPIGGVLGTMSTALLRILDDDPLSAGKFRLSASTYAVTESGGTLTVTVERVDGSSGAVTVDYATSDGNATSGSDYTAASGTLNFAAGEITKTIDIPILEDTLAEGSETFTVTLSNPGGGAILGTPSSAVVTITDNDIPSISIADASGAEGASGTTDLVFTVTLSTSSAQVVRVDYATTGGTATEGTDYQAASGTLTIPAGQTSGQIVVSVNGDTVDENDENFNVTLSNPTNAVIADGTAVGTILNDDDPTISIDDVMLAEGSGGSRNFTFTVSLSGQSLQDVTVAWATEDGTATAGQDYTTASGTLTIAAGQTSGQISVVVTGDTTIELDETFIVNLSAPTNAAIADPQGVGTIVNDDFPTITISDVMVPEGDSGSVNATFTVSLSGDPLQPVTVAWATTDGTATEGQDYTTASGTLTIPAGQTSGQIVVSVNGDTVDENDENFNVTLSNPTNAVIADGTAVGTIQNDDDPTIAIGDVTQAEGSVNGLFVFTVTLSHASFQPVVVTYSTADGTAQAGSDYTGVSSGQVTISPGTLTQSININVVGDGVDEPTEAFDVNVTNATNTAGITKSQGVGSIVNDDDPAVSIADAQVTEGTGTMAFTVTLSHASYEDVVINFSTADGSAQSPGDYGGGDGWITIGAGNLSGQIPISLVNDSVDEQNETFTVTLSAVTNATIADGTATGTILDDDGPSISIADLSDSEGNSGTKTFTFTVGLSSASLQDVMVSFATQNGTATAGEDYEASAGSLTILAGNTSGTIDITVKGDTDSEADETFQVVLSNAVNATISDGIGVGTIETDDPAGLRIEDVTQVEGNSGTKEFSFIVRITNPVAGDVTFNYSTADGSATAGPDYNAASGSGVIPAGQTETAVNVTVNGDTTPEGDEVFFVNLPAVSGAVILDGQAQGTILCDDGPEVTIGDASVDEGDSGTTQITFTVHLSFAWTEDIVIDFATSDGTATTADNDYTGLSGQVTIPVGQTTAEIRIDVTGDRKNEFDETFYVNLTWTSAGIIQDNQATGTIGNDDPVPNITISDVSGLEGNLGVTEFSFTVTLSNPADRDIQVNYTTQDNTAIAWADYQSASGSVTIGAGSITAPIHVFVIGDTGKEPDETFYVNLTGTDFGNITDGQGVGTIQDDEAPTVTEANPQNGATEVPPNTHLVLKFSESMDPATVNTTTVSINPSLTNPLLFYWNSSNDQLTIVFDTTAPTGIEGDDVLAEGQTYTVTLTTGVQSAEGRPLGEAYATAFTTRVDCTPPQIVSIQSDPGNQDPRVHALTGDITGFRITFNENMDVNRGQAQLEYSGGEAYDAISGVGSGMVVSWVNSTTFQIALSGSFNPLPRKKVFLLSLSDMADIKGNYMDFNDITVVTAPTSDATSPTITGTVPSPNQSGVPRDASLMIGFSEPMHPDIVGKIQVTNGAGDTQYDVWYGDAPGVMVVPKKAWPAGATITVTVPGGSPSGVRDAYGNFMIATQTISFTVVGADNTPPTFWEERSAFKNNAVDVSAWNWGCYFLFKKGTRPAFINQQTSPLNGFSLVEVSTGIPYKGYDIEVNEEGVVRLKTMTGMNGLNYGTNYHLVIDADLQDSEGVSFDSTVLGFTTVDSWNGQTRPTVWDPPVVELNTGDMTGTGVQRDVNIDTYMTNEGVADILEVECSDITQMGFNNSSNSGGNTYWFEYDYESPETGESTITTSGTHIFQFDYRDYTSSPLTNPVHEFSIRQWSHVFADSSLPVITATSSSRPTYSWWNLPVSGADECIGAVIVVINQDTDDELWFVVNRAASGTFTHPADMALSSGSYVAIIAAVKMESGTIRGTPCMGFGVYPFDVP